MLSNDITANKLEFSARSGRSNEMASWGWKSRGINIFGQTEARAFKHEVGHSLGLPHAVFIKGSSLYGNKETASGNGIGKYNTNGGLMSYFSGAGSNLKGYEVKLMVSNAIEIARSSIKNQVDVFISGFVYKNVPKKQLEEQLPPTSKETPVQRANRYEKYKGYKRFKDRVMQ